jgi:hypothetical protein
MDGKSELRTALGVDHRTALQSLPRALADLQHQIALLERHAVSAGAMTAARGHVNKVASQRSGLITCPAPVQTVAGHSLKGRSPAMARSLVSGRYPSLESVAVALSHPALCGR